jgi:hypothetical protein
VASNLAEPPLRGLVADANVIIDYLNADLGVLGLIARAVAPVTVPLPILQTVTGLNEADCADIGLEAYAPTDSQLDEAAARRWGAAGLAFDDRLCLIVARDRAVACLTNDKPLHHECKRQNVPAVWGLRPMVHLISGGWLSLEAAFRTADAIHFSNPLFVTTDVVTRFKNQCGHLSQ